MHTNSFSHRLFYHRNCCHTSPSQIMGMFLHRARKVDCFSILLSLEMLFCRILNYKELPFCKSVPTLKRYFSTGCKPDTSEPTLSYKASINNHTRNTSIVCTGHFMKYQISADNTNIYRANFMSNKYFPCFGFVPQSI